MLQESNPQTATVPMEQPLPPHPSGPLAAPSPALRRVPDTLPPFPEPVRPIGRKRLLVWLGAGLTALIVCAAAYWFTQDTPNSHPHHNHHNNLAAGSMEPDPDPDPEEIAEISVNTVLPQRKSLVRTLDQPGSILPSAQAELYAKASGYLKMIPRETTVETASGLTAQGMLAVAPALCGTPLAPAASFAAGARLVIEQAPQLDIGSRVTAGELLIVIDVPELLQDIAQKASIWHQKEAELASAGTAIETIQAAIQAATAQKKQSEAEIRKCEFEYVFHTKQLNRFKDLVRDRTVSAEVVDEKEHELRAVQAAWESSQAKLQVAQAELAVVSSKLATAKADLLVKEAVVKVAWDEMQRSRILADYALIRSPFDGVIAARGVDEGDFIQNATTGQTHLLMTVVAVDRVKVVLQAPARDSSWIHAGSEATMHVDTLDRPIPGRVARVSHSLDTQSRTMRVEIDLDNRDHKLLPGMYGQVAVTLQKIDNAQAIPATAVYSRRGENYILQVQDGVAHRQRVHIRYDDGHELEVVKLVDDREAPLDGSEELIVSNKGEIGENQRVKTTRVTAH